MMARNKRTHSDLSDPVIDLTQSTVNGLSFSGVGQVSHEHEQTLESKYLSIKASLPARLALPDSRLPLSQNERTRIAYDATQNDVLIPTRTDSAYKAHVILVWTTNTPTAERRFQLRLPYRHDIKNFREVPIIPFIQHPRSGSSDNNTYHDKLFHIPNGHHRWRVPASLPELRSHDEYGPFFDQLRLTLGQYMQSKNVPSSRIDEILQSSTPQYKILDPSSKIWVIDLLWSSSYPNIDGISFSAPFHGQAYTFDWVNHGSLAWPFVTLLTVKTSVNVTVDQIRMAVQALPNVIVFDIWKTFVTPKQNPINVKYLSCFTGQWYIAIGLYDQHLQSITKNPIKARRALPGYLNIDGERYFLSYEDRLPYCNHCQPSDFHDRPNCPLLNCERCGIKGDHPPALCSLKIPVAKPKTIEYKVNSS